MPSKQKTTVTIRDDGSLLGESTGQELVSWLADVFSLFAGGRAEILVQRPKRSLRQNRKYWALLTEIAEGFRRAGVTQWHIMGPDGKMIRLPVNKDTLHAWFKRKYLTPDEPEETPTTTTLDQTEMSRYMEKIRHDEDVRKLDIAFRDQEQIPQ